MSGTRWNMSGTSDTFLHISIRSCLQVVTQKLYQFGNAEKTVRWDMLFLRYGVKINLF